MASIKGDLSREKTFEDVGDELRERLEVNAGLEVKTLFEDLQRRFPGRFPDGQLRTLQRRAKVWRALEEPSKGVFLPQVHNPDELGQSDFTRMGSQSFPRKNGHFSLSSVSFLKCPSTWGNYRLSPKN